jgi:hypothetical protein
MGSIGALGESVSIQSTSLPFRLIGCHLGVSARRVPNDTVTKYVAGT